MATQLKSMPETRFEEADNTILWRADYLGNQRFQVAD